MLVLGPTMIRILIGMGRVGQGMMHFTKNLTIHVPGPSMNYLTKMLVLGPSVISILIGKEGVGLGMMYWQCNVKVISPDPHTSSGLLLSDWETGNYWENLWVCK